MTGDKLIAALKRLSINTGSIACLGCGHEHNCGIHGCALIRDAICELEQAQIILESYRQIIDGLRYQRRCKMARYIDTWKNLNELVDKCESCEKRTDDCSDSCHVRSIIDFIEKQPPKDVVEVVRCKDCKYWKKDCAGCTDFVGRCDRGCYMVAANGYCVYGEKITIDDLPAMSCSHSHPPFEQNEPLDLTDVVRVVRCKECNHCRDNICGNYYGFGYGVEVMDDEFCSYGERKEDD